MAILKLNLDKPVEKKIGDYLRQVAIHSKLQKQIDYSNSPEAVSTDFVGHTPPLVDGPTIAAEIIAALFMFGTTTSTGTVARSFVVYDR